MHLFFDIVLGAGLAAAAGIRPFLPVLLAGGLAAAHARWSLAGTDFSFLQSAAFLVVVAFCAAVTIALDRRLGGDRLDTGSIGAALGGVAVGLGALLFAAALARNGYAWWPGIIGGIVCATLGQAAARGLFGRVRGRLDSEARAALPIYVEGGALLAAGIALLFPPLSILVLAFLAWLVAGGRRRSQEKFAGLRILR